jgi:hypothetical protein
MESRFQYLPDLDPDALGVILRYQFLEHRKELPLFEANVSFQEIAEVEQEFSLLGRSIVT